MRLEQEMTDFESWHLQEYGEPAGRFLMWGYYLDPEVQSEWVGFQAGRSTLQLQVMRDVLEKAHFALRTAQAHAPCPLYEEAIEAIEQFATR